MKNILLSAKATVFALLTSSLVFTGCGDSTKNEDPTPQTQNDPQYASAEDKRKDEAFDQAIGDIISRMQREMSQIQANYTRDPDVDFARLTIKHHEAGIAIAEAELKYGKHDEAEKLAESSSRAQRNSARRLQEFLASHGTPEPASTEEFAAFKAEMDGAVSDMIQHMRSSPDTRDVDIDFAEVFKRHHQGIMKMSSIEIEFGDDDEVTDEAQMIIRSQGQEVIELSKFINKHGYPR
ncbi:DUF305 domain-containing protein [Hymenobacter defluvii]|uniref:DUF305 domain-containing protein n=1 Tax=Hymenobacter defluvii TaxID=2054411 RepID=A0ABS3TEP4_9BACT|nr:DUF305 domain-containing protein [Hymenobacter defluvii]MBO3272133.1 DUF305 domain-containing protein [Hymenobacter defluvii]